jgi:tetratricopeptide (TPR) repeat protein
MSLLMEALKRAEREKYKAGADESESEESSAGRIVESGWSPAPALQDKSAFPSLEWVEATPDDSARALETHAPEPEPAETIEPADPAQRQSVIPPLQIPMPREESALDEPLLPQTEAPFRSATPSATKPPAAQEATTAQRQQHAANVLATTIKKPGRNRMLPVAVTAALLLLAAGAFLYWQYPQLASVLGQGGSHPAPIAPPPVTAAIAPVEPSPLLMPQAPPPPMPTAVETVASDMSRADLRQAPPSPAPVVEQAPKEAITIRRGTQKDRVAPALDRGYSAFMAGNDSLAQQEYANILQQDGNNRDALLGMAAIAAKRGHWDEALKTYLRLQELDPRDAAAQAGLLSLTAGQADPVQSESRVKTLLAQQPDAHFLHFALGNLYAGQSRWAEAQQAFFRAYQKAPNNPDYLYNLAISLDHLNQGKLALEYYQRALSRTGPANFDKVAAQNRAKELQQPAEN